MKFFKSGTLTFFLLLSLFITANAFAGRDGRGLPEEWTEVNPTDYDFTYSDLEPSCSCGPKVDEDGNPVDADDEFTFFVKSGKEKNVVVFFQGGGACWDPMNCIAAPTYTTYQSEELWMFSDDNKGWGIFDQTEKNNPFKDWGFVYIPYCTGDLFWGANDQEYLPGVTIKHRGFVNFQAVLAYLKENMGKQNKIFVTGSSAGSYGATMAFPFIKEAFPKSKTFLLGDAGLGVMGGTFPTEGIYNWNVQTPDSIFPYGYDPDMTLADIYTAIAAEYPKSPLAQYTTAFDGTQIFFYNVMLNIDNPYAWGEPEFWKTPALWEEEHKEFAEEWYTTGVDNYLRVTADAASNYRYYIAAGTDHTILMSPKFYTEESAEGVPFAEWVDRMIRTPKNPAKWKNLECEECLPIPEVE